MTADPRRWTLPPDALEVAFGGGPLAPAIAPLRAALLARASALLHGDLPRWREALDALPAVREPRLRGDGAVVTGHSLSPGSTARARATSPHPSPDERARQLLMQLRPWRKGPFCLDGIDIDAEWRSDMKWDRLARHIAPLTGRRVLDVGSGSGYHLWRMQAAGAAAVLGIEPMLLFDSQFRAVARYAPFASVQQLPLRLEDLFTDDAGDALANAPDDERDDEREAPSSGLAFDTVFSMGVLYHARDPHEQLVRLRDLLRPGGQLVLETLVIDRQEDRILHIADRYAGMRNIDRLPSPARLHRWLGNAGLQGMRMVSLAPTTAEEQRATEWSGQRSLVDVLAADGSGLTREGHPAPCRAVVVCERGERR